jgi:hypothetical protein
VREVARRKTFPTKALAVVLLSMVESLCLKTASAQNILMHEYKQIKHPRNIMNAEAKRGVAQVGRYGSDSALGQKFSLPPLPGDQSFADSAEDPEKFLGKGERNLPDFGANERKNVSVVLPAMKGLSQILNSAVTKDFLKEATASETTVLMQTYMMTENGAATGFMGGMNIGSNLMSNLLQSQDFQMKLMDASDSTGKLKEAYVNRVAALMQEGDHKDVWPAALYVASGEDGKMSTAPVMKELKKGDRDKDLPGAFSLKGIASNADNPTKKKLSEILFMGASGAAPQGVAAKDKYAYDKGQLDELREDFVNMVGDVEIDLTSKSQFARDINLKFIAPARMDRCSAASCTPGGDPRRGVARINWEEVQVAWQNINQILFDYCTWKQNNPNSGKKLPFDLETSTTTQAIGQTNQEGVGTPWELASAPDITMTVNVIDQVLKLYEDHRAKGDLQCDKLKLDETAIPSDANINSNGDKNLNDCDANQGCLKNRVVLHLSYMIARSRTLHTYRALHTISHRFVTDQFTGELVDKLFDRAFSGMNVNQELEANRARYADFITYMGQLTQGSIGAGPLMRPGSNNNSEMVPK